MDFGIAPPGILVNHGVAHRNENPVWVLLFHFCFVFFSSTHFFVLLAFLRWQRHKRKERIITDLSSCPCCSQTRWPGRPLWYFWQSQRGQVPLRALPEPFGCYFCNERNPSFCETRQVGNDQCHFLFILLHSNGLIRIIYFFPFFLSFDKFY